MSEDKDLNPSKERTKTAKVTPWTDKIYCFIGMVSYYFKYKELVKPWETSRDSGNEQGTG